MSTSHYAHIVYGCPVTEEQWELTDEWESHGLSAYDLDNSPSFAGVIGLPILTTDSCAEFDAFNLSAAQQKFDKALAAIGRPWPFGKPRLMLCQWSC